MSDVGNLGMGVMLNMLGGNEKTAAACNAAIGNKIKTAWLRDDVLTLTLEDGRALKLWDDGQSCCENRYMRTDDDLQHYIGAEVRGFELREATNMPDTEYSEDHEVQFLVIQTDKGELVFSSHNEHNGYYGGFAIVASLEDEVQP